MPHRTQSRHGSTSGTILLETLLVLPLYMVLLGGIFWLADLAIARHRLLVADRYAAWTLADRHAAPAPDAADVKTALQTADDVYREQVLADQVLSVDPAGSAWHAPAADGWCLRHACARSDNRLPEWAAGWYHAQRIFWSEELGEDPLAVEPPVELRGRNATETAPPGPPPYPTEGHVILMRNHDAVAAAAPSSVLPLAPP